MKLLVFRHGGAVPPAPPDVAGEEWLLATPRTIRSLFSDDPRRERRFLDLLDAGYMGLFLAGHGQWMAYGWLSWPGESPVHLPRWVSRLGCYWIFSCHTRETFRGKGYYKKLLHRIVLLTRSREAAPLYVDTAPGNIPSRRAILSTGFCPAGVIITYRLWLPRSGHFVLAGPWRRNEFHPPLAPPLSAR